MFILLDRHSISKYFFLYKKIQIQYGKFMDYHIAFFVVVNQVYLGNYPKDRFLEIKAQLCISKFQLNLKVFSEEVEARNAGMDLPYTYLLPKNIPNSITN